MTIKTKEKTAAQIALEIRQMAILLFRVADILEADGA